MPQRTLVPAAFGRISGFLPLIHFGTMAAAAPVIRNRVADVFRDRGYDGIIHTNDVEDRVSGSWAIIDGSQAVIGPVEQRPITDFGRPGGA